MSYNGADLIFPHLGIVIEKMKNHITVFNFDIMYYGMIIGLGFILGMLIAQKLAERKGMDTDALWDFFIYLIISGVIGARIYYVAFNWDYYRSDPIKIFAVREGGLAIYGGIIAVVLVLVIFCRVKKQKFGQMIDVLMPGLLLGQLMGRWGNFFNCEAFGRYTDSFFAMRIKKSLVNPSMIDEEILNKVINDNGIEYIQVHPTFLYESLWNLAGFIFILWYGKKKQKFDGELFLLYMMIYGTGRFWIEGLRTDSLYIAGTSLRVSQGLSLVIAIVSLIIFIVKHKRLKADKCNLKDEVS